MLKSSLHDCSHAYIHVQGTITIPNTGTAAAPNNRKKKLIFKKMCSIYWLHERNKQCRSR